MKNAVLFLFIIFSSVVFSQKIIISGLVKDSETGARLPYVSIQVKNTNYGTITNSDGQFKIILDPGIYDLNFSLIGYSSKTLSINSTQTIEVTLNQIPYQMGEVTANSLTWAEQFILDAIAAIQERRKELHFYNADAYSKTTFTMRKNEIFGLVEAISRIQFLEPDLHKEKLSVLKISPNMKNMPYRIIAVNQSINLMNQSSKIWNFLIVSPLCDNALQYYDVSFKRKTRINNDTVVVLEIIPRKKNIPLYEGELYFLMDTHRLIEADLRGNQQVKDATFDSLKLYQKYSLKDSVFNLPSFTKFSLSMNLMMFQIKYKQEYTFANYTINKVNDKPFITEDNSLVEEPNLNISYDFKRDELFKVPLTVEEEKFNKKMEDMFVNAPLYRKVLFYLLRDFFPLITDQPSEIGGLRFSNLSNIYHFNKVEGHFAGLEYTIFNNEEINLYSKAGYAFGANEFEFDLNFRWKRFSLSIHNNITNLGEFEYVRTIHTIDALFNHEDDLNYFRSTGVEVKYTLPLSGKLSVTPFIHFEKQNPIANSTEFSFFARDGRFKDNFQIPEYSNNKLGIKLEYIENVEFWGVDRQIFHGQSFTNIFASVESGSKKILNSTENTTEWNLEIARYQEIFDPVNLKLQFGLRSLNGSEYINKMHFINESETFESQRNSLTFYTLYNYDFYLKDFLWIKSDITLFSFPQIFWFRMSLGGYYAFLRPMNTVNLNSTIQPLTSNFHEYGLSLKGVSMINIYFLKNNLYPHDLFVKLDFSF